MSRQNALLLLGGIVLLVAAVVHGTSFLPAPGQLAYAQDPNPFGEQPAAEPFGGTTEEGQPAAPKPRIKRSTGRDQADIAPAADVNLAAVIGISFEEVPLSEAVAYLSEASGTPFYIRARALDDIGVGTDTPVTLQLGAVKLSTALDFLLLDLDLDYFIQDGIVVVTSVDDAEMQEVRRIYPVRDLLALSQGPYGMMYSGGMMGGGFPGGMGGMMPGMPGMPGMGLGEPDGGLGVGGGDAAGFGGDPGGLGGIGFGGASGGGGRPGMGMPGGGMASMGSGGEMGPGGMGGMSGGMGGLGGPGGGGGYPMPPHPSPLIKLIIDTVAPDTWEVNGGPGAISELGGVLVVRQSDRVQREIADLLSELREQLAR